MKHNTTTIPGPSHWARALIALAISGLTANAALAATTPKVGVDGDCSASASTSIVSMLTGVTTTSGSSNPCTKNWTASAEKQSASGSASASSNLSGASAGYAASAEFGRLSVSTRGGEGAMAPGISRDVFQMGAASRSSNAYASFADTLRLDSAILGSVSSYQVLVSGLTTVDGYTQGESAAFIYGPLNTRASFDILLNGISIYTSSNSGNSLYGGVQSVAISYAFTAQASDMIEVIGLANSQSSSSSSGYIRDSASDSGTANLSINIDILGNSAQLIAASGHNYASAISPIPEPATWALMAVGLLGIGASSARRSKTHSLNAAT